MTNLTSKLIRFFSLILLFTFMVESADAQRKQRGERQTRERQERKVERSARAETDTPQQADETPEFHESIEDGSMPELKQTQASGRRRAGRRSARIAGAGKAEGSEALENFLVHPNQYIAKWRESRGESRWMKGTAEECAAECLNPANQWCDAFFAYNWNGRDICVLTDDVDPMRSYVSEGLTLTSYTYYDKATADKAASVDELGREVAQLEARILALQRDNMVLQVEKNRLAQNLQAAQSQNQSGSSQPSSGYRYSGQAALNHLRNKHECYNCDFRGVTLGNGYYPFGDNCFRDSNFSGVDLSGQRFDFSDLSGADFSNANLRNAGLTRTSLEGAKIIGADLTGATLLGAIWVDRNLCADPSQASRGYGEIGDSSCGGRARKY